MKIIRSFASAWAGIKSCFLSEPNFRIHSIFIFVVLILSVVFKIAVMEWIAIGFCIALVTAFEVLNTAIEKLCDVVNKDFHPGIKKVKDMAAGAVLISALISFITGLCIFLPKINLYLKSI
jgi:diacylglycerol kinase